MARREEDDWRQQAKNSLNVRNVQPAIKSFRGDPKLAAGYLPLAQVLLGDLENRLALGGIDQGERLVKLSNGTLIRIIYHSGIRQIEIDARFVPTEEQGITVFMESGFVSLLEAQGQLYYMDDQLSALSVEQFLDYLVSSKKINTDNLMDLFVLKFRLRKAAGEFPWLSLAFLENNDAENIKLIDRQREWASLPSAETGKNKLLVQAYLGRKNGTVTALANHVFCSWPTRYSVVATNVLYTTENYDYYLVEVEFSIYGEIPATLKFYKLKFNRVSNSIFRDLKSTVDRFGYAAIIANQDFVKIFYVLEAYGLSGYVESELVKTFTVEELMLPINYGLPFAWGWKANWQGNECSIVTTYGHADDGGDYLYTDTYLHTMSLDFNEVYEDNQIVDYTLTASMQTSGPFYFKPQKLRIFAPEILNVAYWRMLQLYFVVAYDDDPAYEDTPLYCYYDNEDQLVVLYCSYIIDDTPAPPPESALNQQSCALEPLLWKSEYYDEPKWLKTNKLSIKRLTRTNKATIPITGLPENDTIIECGFGSNEAEMVDMEANEISYTNSGTNACAFYMNAFCEPTKSYFNTTKRCTFMQESGSYKINKREIQTTTSVAYAMSLIIPYQSSEAFYIGRVQYYNKQGVRQFADDVGYLSVINVHRLTVTYVAPAEEGYPGPGLGESFETKIHSNFEGHIAVALGETTGSIDSVFFNEDSMSAGLFVFGKSAMNVEAFTETAEGDGCYYLWDGMMNLTIDNPWIPTPFIINESINGTIKYTYKWKDFSVSYIEDDEYLKFNNNESNLPTLAQDKKYSVFCGWS